MACTVSLDKFNNILVHSTNALCIFFNSKGLISEMKLKNQFEVTIIANVLLQLYYFYIQIHQRRTRTTNTFNKLQLSQELDALAAHLNKLGDQQPSQPEAPPRNNRNSKQSQSAANNNVSTPGSASNHTSNATNQGQPHANILDSLVDSESDSEQEDGGRVRNDGTLLASDPPKPL